MNPIASAKILSIERGKAMVTRKELEAQVLAAEAARDEARAERDTERRFRAEDAANHLDEQAALRAVTADLSALLTSHQALIAALTEPPLWHREPLHERVERECWKQHPDDFNSCEHPACLLLKRIAVVLGWTVNMNGVTPSTTAGETP